MNVKTKVAGFCVILSEEKWKEGNLVPNVSFTDFTKRCIKNKIAYTSDVEMEVNGDYATIRRKIVFPSLNAEQLVELMESSCLSYSSETIGSITIEYGWLHAVAFEYWDNISRQNTNAYISVLFDFEGFDNVEKESHCMLSNYKFQEEITEEIMECLKDEDFDSLEDITKKEFIYDLSQLEFQF